MHDFVSEFWSWFIIIPTVLGIIGCFVLLVKLSGGKIDPDKKAEKMGHVWDEDLEELNNPLPMWWLFMFHFIIVFGVIYLILYPGLGSFEGVLDNDDRFGISVCSIGDLNNDHIIDIAVGAYHDDNGGTDCGAVYNLFLQRVY